MHASFPCASPLRAVSPGPGEAYTGASDDALSMLANACVAALDCAENLAPLTANAQKTEHEEREGSKWRGQAEGTPLAPTTPLVPCPAAPQQSTPATPPPSLFLPLASPAAHMAVLQPQLTSAPSAAAALDPEVEAWAAMLAAEFEPCGVEEPCSSGASGGGEHVAADAAAFVWPAPATPVAGLVGPAWAQQSAQPPPCKAEAMEEGEEEQGGEVDGYQAMEEDQGCVLAPGGGGMPAGDTGPQDMDQSEDMDCTPCAAPTDSAPFTPPLPLFLPPSVATQEAPSPGCSTDTSWAALLWGSPMDWEAVFAPAPVLAPRPSARPAASRRSKRGREDEDEQGHRAAPRYKRPRYTGA